MFFLRKKKSHWEAMSSILRLKNYLERNNIKVMSKTGVLLSPNDHSFFHDLDSNIHEIIREGRSNFKTDLKIFNDDLGTVWVLIKDEDFSELISTTYTVINAVSNIVKPDNIIGSVFKLDMSENKLLDVYNKIENCYLIFNSNDLGYYPYIPFKEERLSSLELELNDLLNSKNLEMLADVNKWYGISSIPF
jgi:hypothetical protein